MSALFWIAVVSGCVIVAAVPIVRCGMRWGATAAERERLLPGDECLAGGPPLRTAMTRAITIAAPPAEVWPWIAQAGRGAGWYSYDWIDNGRRASAWHVVSWIPEPALGDATAIGYLRGIEGGRSLTWWVPGLRFAGAAARLVVHYRLEPMGERTRVIARMSADATGRMARIALLVFQIMDSIMARRQLLGLRERIERPRTGETESGDRDQYQVYCVLYASGETAGVVGKEQGARWRQAAIDDGVFEDGAGA